MTQTKTAYDLSDWLGYLSHAEVDLLKTLAQRLPAGPQVVNIGAGCGTGALALLESRPDLALTTVDIQEGASPLGCLEGERAELDKSGIDYYGRYRQIHGDSKAVTWLGAPINMVFIDGDHTYQGCRGDILAWLPRVAPGGVLALHDYRKAADDKPHPGVDRAVDELLLGRYEVIGHAGTLIAFRVPR